MFEVLPYELFTFTFIEGVFVNMLRMCIEGVFVDMLRMCIEGVFVNMKECLLTCIKDVY